MGEKEGKNEKKEVKGENKKEGGGDKGGKKEDSPLTVVMKVDMHCEGCALKIKKSVKNFEGVDAVSTDLANSKLTVIGRVDPAKLRERVETKIRKKVDLISPVNASKKDGNSASKDSEAKKPQSDKDQKKPDEKKSKEPQVSTVVLKIPLHCEGCIKRIRKAILGIKGVQTVNIDSQKDLVTVKGTMDASSLQPYLKGKLKRSVDLIPQKKEGGGGGGNPGEKKEKGGDGGGGEKKGKEGGGEKKEGKDSGKKDEGGEQKQTQEAGPATVAFEANKMEYYTPYGAPYGAPYIAPYGGPYGYRPENVHAPQLFSDENPNACSIM